MDCPMRHYARISVTGGAGVLVLCALAACAPSTKHQYMQHLHTEISAAPPSNTTIASVFGLDQQETVAVMASADMRDDL
jgi:hypothetical protein